MRRSLITAVLIITAACAAAPFKPETAHPTPQRMAELLAAPVAGKGAKLARLTFEASVCPGFLCTPNGVMQAGAGTWVQCMVPETIKASTILISLEGHNSSTHALDRIQHRLWIERVSCGTWVASCVLSNGERRDAKLEAKGECNREDK